MTINAVVPPFSSRSSLLTTLAVSATGTFPNSLPTQDQDKGHGPPATRQRPHHALDVPEILNHVGYFLSNKDTVACVRVSKDWHQVFTPVLWEHVDTSKWSSWLLWQGGNNNDRPAEPVLPEGRNNDTSSDGQVSKEGLEKPTTTMPLAMGMLQQALERNGHHIRTLTIVDLRIEGLVQLLDRCLRLETLVLWPDAFEEDVDDDDDDYQVDVDEDEIDHESDGEEEEEKLPLTARMTADMEDCSNPIVKLLNRNRNLSKVEIFVGYSSPSGAFWRTLASLSVTTTVTPQDSSPLPRRLPPPPPPKLPPCRGLRSFQSSLGLEIKRLDHLDHFLQMLQRLHSLELENCYIPELRCPDSLSKKTTKSHAKDTTSRKMTSSTLWFPHLRHVRFSRIRSLSVQSQFRILQACPELESLDWRVPRLGFPVDEFCETLQRSYFSSTLTNTTPHWIRLTSLTLPESRLKDDELAKILRAMQCGLKSLIVRRSDFGVQAFEALMKGWQYRALMGQLLGANGRRRSSSSSTFSSGSLSSESWNKSGGSGSDDESDFSSESYASRLSWERVAEQKGPDHWRTITHLDLGQCQAVTSVMTQCILRGCAKLESFDGYEIRAEDMIQFEEEEGTVAMENDESQFAMDVDETTLSFSNKSGLASPPPSPLLDSPLSASMPRSTFKRRLSQQHYGRSPLWTYSSFEKHDPPSKTHRRESNSEFIHQRATTRLWWSCDKIRHLDVHITGLGPFPDPRHKAVFEQLARLHQLVHLSICSQKSPTSPMSVPVSTSISTTAAAVADSPTPPVSTPLDRGYTMTTSLPSPPSSPPTEFSATVVPLSATALFKYPGMGSHPSSSSSHSSTYHSAGNRNESPITAATTVASCVGGLELRVRSGLYLLAPLKKLRVLRFKGVEVMMPDTSLLFFEKNATHTAAVAAVAAAGTRCDHRRPLMSSELGEEDVQWLVDHLLDLKFVEGRLHSDVEEQKRLSRVLENRGVVAWTSVVSIT